MQTLNQQFHKEKEAVWVNDTLHNPMSHAKLMQVGLFL